MEVCLNASAIVCSSPLFSPKDNNVTALHLSTSHAGGGFKLPAPLLASPPPPPPSSASSSLRLSEPVSRGIRGRRMRCKAQASTNEVLVVTESSWNSSVIENQTPVLVEFWAPWCGPCRMIAPVVDELAKEYSGRVACFKVNTDDCPGIATQYGIRSIPTVLLFKNGEKKETVIGAVPKSTLTSTIEKYL